LCLIVCFAQVGHAAPMGKAFTYQGRLMDANLPADEIYDFRFKLFDELSDGNQVGIDVNAPDVDVIDGYFTVALDFNDVGVFNGDARWLDIGVRPGDSNDPNAFVTLSPRTELTPTPYALQTRGIFVDEAGKVGIGTKEPGTKLHVESGGAKAVFGENTASGGIGVQGQASNFSGGGVGVYGTSYSTDGIGVFGIAAMSTGKNYGIYGQSQSPDGWAGYFHGHGHFSGNVGIGTTEPGATLDIIGDLATRNPGSTPNGSQILLSSPQGNPGLIIQLGDGAGNRLNQWVTGVHSDESYYIQERGASGSVGTKHMVIASGGYIGIGTESPTRDLHIYRNAGPAQVGIVTADTSSKAQVIFGDGGGNNWTISSDNTDDNKLHFRSGHASGTPRVTFQQNGNVGIGTTAPVDKLHVKSRIRIEGSNTSFPFLDLVNWAGTGRWTLYGDNDNDFRIAEYVGTLRGDRIVIKEGGNVGIGTTSPGAKLDVAGRIRVSNTAGDPIVEIGEGLDYAEGFDVTEEADIEAGTVLVIDSENPGKLTASRSAYDSKVAGIVAGAKGMGSGVRLGVGQFDYDVALAGRVYCNVDATQTAVQAGDLLTTSATAGYAMKAADYDRARGAILGKAMQKLELGQKARILVLVTLQ